jgi:hypothetical protein
MSSLTTIHLGILLIQEPRHNKCKLPAIAGYTLIPPQTQEPNIIPLAAIYISYEFLRSFSIVPLLIRQADLVGITITSRLPNALPLCSFLSAYNRFIPGSGHSLASYTNLFEFTSPACLIAGDFNLRSHTWDSKWSFNNMDTFESAPFESAMAEASFLLISLRGIYTWLPYGQEQPSVHDLGYTSLLLLPVISEATILLAFGSDHLPICFQLNTPPTVRARLAPN